MCNEQVRQEKMHAKLIYKLLCWKIYFQQAEVCRAQYTYTTNNKEMKYLLNTVKKINNIKTSNKDNNISVQKI